MTAYLGTILGKYTPSSYMNDTLLTDYIQDIISRILIMQKVEVWQSPQGWIDVVITGSDKKIFSYDTGYFKIRKYREFYTIFDTDIPRAEIFDRCVKIINDFRSLHPTN